MRTKQAFPEAEVLGTHRKTAPASFKADLEQGIVEQWVSVFNNIDLEGDRVLPGFFADSLDAWQKSGDPIPTIFSHQWDNLDAYVGEVLEAEEMAPGDKGLPEEIRDLGGLYTKSQYDLEDPAARKLLKLLKRRIIKEASFAYDLLEDRQAKDGAHELVKGHVIEVGPTLKGMNPVTQTGTVKALMKALERDLKAAIASHSTATSSGAWDGPANEANLSTDAGASTYRKAYAWQDPDGDSDTKDAYKFIHHEVSSDGDVGAANLTACSTGIGVLNGGRGGTVIPDSDREGVHAHLARHMRDGDMEPPELKSRSNRHTKTFVTLEGSYEATREMLWSGLQEWVRESQGGRGAWCELEATYDDRVIVGVETFTDDSFSTAYWEVPYTLSDGAVEFGEAREVAISGSVAPKARGWKEGRRHSGTDEGRIQSAHDLLVELGAKCSEADDAKRDEPPGAKRDELPSPASLRLWAELQEVMDSS